MHAATRQFKLSRRRVARGSKPVGLSGFVDVDTCGDPQALVEYLDVTHGDEQAHAARQGLVRALAPREGDHLLDVGCGVGHMTLELARLVGNTGCVTGIDNSMIMINEARKRLHRAGSLPVDFHVEDAHRLSFADHSFHGCIVISTLMYVSKPHQVLSEIGRVLKPGGRIAIQECDWHTMELKTGNSIVDHMITAILKRRIRNKDIGNRLPALLEALGFQGITVSTGTLTTLAFAAANRAWRIGATIRQAAESRALSANRAAKLMLALAKTETEGSFFGAVTGHVVVGESPTIATRLIT
ncbi:MAG: methyltransferase domain-containing protein [Nitrospiraceae bacterium]